MPGLLSWVVTVIRGSKFKASDVFPGPGSNSRHPLSVFPSLSRVLRDQFPRRHQYYEGATTSCRPSRRTSLPSFGGTSVALVAFAPRRTSAPPRPGVGNPVAPSGKLPRKRQDLPSSWGISIVRLHVFPRRRQDYLHQTITVQQHDPWSIKGKGSHERSFDAQ